MYPPAEIAAKTAGEYNHTTILVKRSACWALAEGQKKKVVEYEFWSPGWQELKEKGKWKDAKAYGMAKKGHIALQDHGGGIWFQNIKLRKL